MPAASMNASAFMIGLQRVKFRGSVVGVRVWPEEVEGVGLGEVEWEWVEEGFGCAEGVPPGK